MSGWRLPEGGRIDRARPLAFTFDGRRYTGFAGDTLASALLANGVRLVGRSFKLHRPRGILGIGAEEPNALVEVGQGARRTPNRPATLVELTDGLVARSQNRWPALGLDLMAVAGLFAPVLTAGFYYKTFKWPRGWWERVYEPAIRRAAGLGRAPVLPDPDHYETVHTHTDLLIVGAGVAGLAAAAMAARAGKSLLLLEAGTLLGPLAPEPWRTRVLDELASLPAVKIRTCTTVVGAYESSVFAGIEQRPDGQRLQLIRAARTIVATGATERLPAFPGNDRPGVMLASAVRTYLRRYAVAAGRRIALFAADDAAYACAFDLHAAGAEVAAIVDPRPASLAAERAAALGLEVRLGHEVAGVAATRDGVYGIAVQPVGGRHASLISADVLAVSGGTEPDLRLLAQAGATSRWDAALAAFVPDRLPTGLAAVGAARGIFGEAAAILDGLTAGAAAAGGATIDDDLRPSEPDAPDSPAAPIWRVAAPDKAFVDLQHDVTVADLEQAHREGYGHIEHAKRYTTHGMGTDQGRTGGLVGAAVLAAARGVPIEAVGLPRHRPFTRPTTWGALAGEEVGADFLPERRLPLHEHHAAAGAVFAKIGTWLRPLVYSPTGDTSWAPVIEEARHVRRAVGLTDMSSLGKIDVQGPDAATFLDRVYANRIGTLAVGRCRYGLMLREDGIVLDDGTVTRLGPTHFLLTTTTQKAEEVLLHLEWHLATVWPDLDLTMTDVADHWAQFALAGPRSRDVLAALLPGLDVADAALPFMAMATVELAGVPGRLFRISFSGERAFELAVPANHGADLWDALLAAGAAHGIRAYGLDALNVLRIEKGHLTGAEINGNTTPCDLGLDRLLKKEGDFVGRVLGQRPGLLDPKRLELVGLTPVRSAERLRGGAHLVAEAGKGPSQGYLTSVCMAAATEGWIALGLLESGHARRGERLIATSPVHGEHVEVIVGSPHRHDPENSLVRG